MIGFYNYTVVITYLSVISACTSICFAFEGNIKWAILMLVISGLCDMLDGPIARTKKNRTDTERKFGIQIDSLSDVISFGVAPACIIYNISVHLCAPGSEWLKIPAIVAGIALLICAVIRLAFFNVSEEERQETEGKKLRDSYRGLPVTNVALIFPIVSLVSYFVEGNVFVITMIVATALTAFFYVLDFKMVKLHGKKLAVIGLFGFAALLGVFFSPLAGF
ncbi:MAG: CDP-alcohol phosphatidyltransferase family protein [Lachnospiraceae bacterium]|nr:CDP-alcohol phosphatidyltransferase family protein [Lachnospiraceae bacterium]